MISFSAIESAASTLNGVIPLTPLQYNQQLSERLQGEVWFKREDLQIVRSYKIRGAYTKMASLSVREKGAGVVCASAGNHAQGVAFSCARMHIRGTIFMPATTPKQKIEQVKLFGKQWITIELIGDTFDAAFDAALLFQEQTKASFVHPFDDLQIIAGQGTVGLEIIRQLAEKPDVLLVPIGGGGLASGIIAALRTLSPNTQIIGVEPQGAPSMQQALAAGKVVRLDTIDKFIDGAAVQQVGKRTFEICQQGLDRVITVPEGKVCETILRLYNEEAMVVEPAGALTVAAAELYPELIRGKRAVCIVSGSNNDITRMSEIQERALLYRGLKHYFLIEFPQRPSALKAFVTDILSDQDDITYFQFAKKNNRESGPAVVGIETQASGQLEALQTRMTDYGFAFEYLNDRPALFHQLVG